VRFPAGSEWQIVRAPACTPTRGFGVGWRDGAIIPESVPTHKVIFGSVSRWGQSGSSLPSGAFQRTAGIQNLLETGCVNAFLTQALQDLPWCAPTRRGEPLRSPRAGARPAPTPQEIPETVNAFCGTGRLFQSSAGGLWPLVPNVIRSRQSGVYRTWGSTGNQPRISRIDTKKGKEISETRVIRGKKRKVPLHSPTRKCAPRQSLSQFLPCHNALPRKALRHPDDTWHVSERSYNEVTYLFTAIV